MNIADIDAESNIEISFYMKSPNCFLHDRTVKQSWGFSLQIELIPTQFIHISRTPKFTLHSNFTHHSLEQGLLIFSSLCKYLLLFMEKPII